MKIFSLTSIMIFSLLSFQLFAQDNNSLHGAWHSQNGEQEIVLVFQDGYFTQTVYTGKEFLLSYGGPYKINGKQIDISIEFNSKDKEEVGTQLKSDYGLNDNALSLHLKGGEIVSTR